MRSVQLAILVLTSACSRSAAPPEQTSAAPVETPAVSALVSEPIAPLLEALPCDADEEVEAIVSSGDDRLRLREVRFEALPGWKQDAQAQAAIAFAASCTKLAEMEDTARVGAGPFGGRAADWRPACASVGAVTSDDAAARFFFEEHFRAYEAHGQAGPEGKITGYYMQPLRASRTRGGPYQFPLYKRPADLVSIELSEFVADGRGRRVWGRLDSGGGSLRPYPSRTEFRNEIADREDAHVLLWADSPADAVHLEIEGSGRALLDDGSELMVAFAGKNGRKSGRLGSIARAMRKLEKNHRKGTWTPTELAAYEQIIAQKTSVVFFEVESRDGAIGTQDVILTPRRSLAVDRAIVPLSTPVWVQTRAPTSSRSKPGPWQRLLIAQDTGGAILGSIRGDIYWGDDREAVRIGKRVNGKGRMWLLLPRSIELAEDSKQLF